MPTSIVRHFRLCCGLLAAALVLQWLIFPAGADPLSDFQAALDDAAAQHRTALRTLETQGQQETAAAVHRFRQSWQQVIDSSHGIAADATDRPAVLLDVDLRIVGVLLVIDLGNRDAARNALEAIAGKMNELGRAAPR